MPHWVADFIWGAATPVREIIFGHICQGLYGGKSEAAGLQHNTSSFGPD